MPAHPLDDVRGGTSQILAWEPGGHLAHVHGCCRDLVPGLTEPGFLFAGSMADAPREGKLARCPNFIQLIDMASESVGGKVSGSLDKNKTERSLARDASPWLRA